MEGSNGDGVVEGELHPTLVRAMQANWKTDYAQMDKLLEEHSSKHPAAAALYCQSMWIRVCRTKPPPHKPLCYGSGKHAHAPPGHRDGDA